MKSHLKYHVLKFTLALVFTACNIMLFAQPPGGPPPGGGGATGTLPPCWEPECVPVDGGIAFLIAAGAAFGIRKLYPKS